MQYKILVALGLITAGLSAANAQRRPAAAGSARSADVSIGYNYIGANVPPGGSQYFGLSGGYVSGSLGIKDWLSVAGEFTGGRATKISTIGQDLTLMTYMGGPRIVLSGHRIVPFGEALFGGAHASDSYFPSGTSSAPTATSFAFSAGGGFDFNLTRRFAIRAMDVKYLRTSFPNGSTNEQNQLMLGAGLVIRFGNGMESAPLPSRAPAPDRISFACSTDVASLQQGKILAISGVVITQPAGSEVNYTWTSNGGSVDGAGNRVTLNTASLPPGDYHVTGHASLASNSSTSAECEVRFRVLVAEAPSSDITDNSDSDKVFHQNVQDALFDYDSYQIRPDAQVAVNKAAQYLKANPAIGVLIGGYADERGSAEYNLALAEKRANAARNALIQAGIPEDRLEIISYGKEAQVCTEQTEACFQQNRRAAFNMRH